MKRVILDMNYQEKKKLLGKVGIKEYTGYRSSIKERCKMILLKKERVLNATFTLCFLGFSEKITICDLKFAGSFYYYGKMIFGDVYEIIIKGDIFGRVEVQKGRLVYDKF